MAEPFFVTDSSGSRYPAKFLADSFGKPIYDSNWGQRFESAGGKFITSYLGQFWNLYESATGGATIGNANGRLIAPAGYDVADIIGRGKLYGDLLAIGDPEAATAAQALFAATFINKLGTYDTQYPSFGKAVSDTLSAAVISESCCARTLGPEAAKYGELV